MIHIKPQDAGMAKTNDNAALSSLASLGAGHVALAPGC